MISVYLDESRHGDPNSFMVVAGFWGNKEQWDGLIPDWVSGLGKRKSLHMCTLRLNSKRGTERARPLLERLGPLPYKHGLTPVYAGVRTGDYLDIVANTQHEYRLPGYAICLVGIMSSLSRTVPSHQSIKIICEIQKTYEDRACRVFQQICVTPPFNNPSRPYFSGIEFIPKHSSVLTQPSDFLAYAIAQGYENRTSHKALLCEPIIGPKGVLGLPIGRDEIRRLMTKAKRTLGQRWYE